MNKEMDKSLVSLLANLDWKKILHHAINEGVFNSAWNKNPVREWRNASDSIYCSILFHLRETGIDPYRTIVKISKLKESNKEV